MMRIMLDFRIRNESGLVKKYIWRLSIISPHYVVIRWHSENQIGDITSGGTSKIAFQALFLSLPCLLATADFPHDAIVG
jgi:hypothetical protein